MSKEDNFVLLNLDDNEQLLEVIGNLSSEDFDKLKHFMWIVEMEKDHCPKKQKSYFNEFNEIYMGDCFVEGDVVNNVKEEIEELSGRLDEGSAERVFYLKRWLNNKFSK